MKTIAEIHGLDKDDPWDKRTEQQKEKDKLFIDQFNQEKPEIKKGKLYFKLFVKGLCNITDVSDKIINSGITQDGVWMLFLSKIDATLAKEKLNNECTITVVTDKDEEIVINTAEEKKEFARPWNNLKKEGDLDISEFIFAIKQIDKVCEIYITPKTYFETHGQIWKQSLDIKKYLPTDFVETNPGVYESKRKKENLFVELSNRGFLENFEFQLHVNALDLMPPA